MQGIHTAHCFFEECDFTFARLNDSFHQSSAFLSCEFHGASLFAAGFEQCKCTGTTFAGADLTACTIKGGDYSFTILNDCDFHGWDLPVSYTHLFGMGGCLEEHLNLYSFLESGAERMDSIQLDLLLPIREKKAD